MRTNTESRNGLATFARILMLPCLVAVAAVSGRFAWSLSVRWAVLLITGEVALALMSFTWPEIRGAIRFAAGRTCGAVCPGRAAFFWEAMARNAWCLGVFGTLAGFVIQVCSDASGPDAFLSALGEAILSTVYGAALAAFMSVPLFRPLGEGVATEESGSKPGPFMRWERWLGYCLFAGLVAWIFFTPSGSGPFRPLDWFVHWPAWLVVVGGAFVLAVLAGDLPGGRSLVMGFTCAGLVGSLLGSSQALQGFSRASIQAVAEGISFMVSSASRP